MLGQKRSYTRFYSSLNAMIPAYTRGQAAFGFTNKNFKPASVGCQLKEFTMVVLDLDQKVFIAYMAFSILKTLIHLACGFLATSTMQLLQLTSINNYAINLVKNKQSLSSPVYELSQARNSEDGHQDLANRISWLSIL